MDDSGSRQLVALALAVPLVMVVLAKVEIGVVLTMGTNVVLPKTPPTATAAKAASKAPAGGSEIFILLLAAWSARVRLMWFDVN